MTDEPRDKEGVPFDVFSHLVESPDDFLGLLAYSLYKRHKIEWIQAHPDDNHEAFKKVACTHQQVAMYRYQAEQMAKSFIDVSLEQLVEEMRASLTTELLITRFDTMQPALVAKIDQLKVGFWRNFGNHILSGIASVAVALAVFGIFTLYGDFQKKGGLEGSITSFNRSAETPPAVTNVQPASTLNAPLNPAAR